MNTDPQKSAQSCGCDEGANHKCEQHHQLEPLTSDFSKPIRTPEEARKIALVERLMERSIAALNQQVDEMEDKLFTPAATPRPGLFPDSAQGRKDHPVFTGFLMYFPEAIAAVAHVSKLGSEQHNPGEPLHWNRAKSTDQMDTAARHQMDHGVGTTKDSDGAYHLAKAIWRLCAELQLTIEKERATNAK